MLIDGRHWYGYEIHFKSGTILSDIISPMPHEDDMWVFISYRDKEIYSMNADPIEFYVYTTFDNCTSWDDPEVQEWLKEHAQKITREEK